MPLPEDAKQIPPSDIEHHERVIILKAGSTIAHVQAMPEQIQGGAAPSCKRKDC